MNGRRIKPGTFILLMAIIVSLAACRDNSSSVETDSPASVTSQIPVQSPDAEPTDSVNMQETPGTQPAEDELKNKYHIIKFDWYDENETLAGYGEYEYDENGNLLKLIGYTLDGVATSVMTYEYEFYQDGTISEQRGKQETPKGINIWNYSYDEHGNLITIDYQSQEKDSADDSSVYLGGYASSTSELGRVYSYATRTFTYDASGQAIRFDITNKNTGEALGWGEITYEVAGTLVKYNVYNSDDELSYQGETVYDSDHRALSIKYIEDGEITDWFTGEYDEFGHQISSGTYMDNSWTRWIYIYDSDGRLLSQSMYWDDTLMSRYEATEWIPFSTGNATGSNNPGSTVSEAPSVDIAELYDYVLCSGGGYQIVAKMEETVTSVIEYVGVLDADYNWVIPLSSGTYLNPDGKVAPWSNSSKFEDRCQSASSGMKYAGEGIFVVRQSSNIYGLFGESTYTIYSGNHTTRLFNVITNTWIETGSYGSRQSLTFCDSYYVATNDTGLVHDGEYVTIITPTGATETNIYCKNTTYLGRYSEGLFFSYDGFYDIEGNRVINLSQYAGTIINQPYFNNGTCKLEAKNENGTVFVAEIDSNGRYISEFTKKE